MPTLAVTGLRRRLGSAEVLAGVDLEVPTGTLHCLVGPSGSGKTTLLKILAGKLDPDGGKVSLDGRDWSFTPPAKRGIAMVMQNYALFPHLSVLENAAFGLEELGVPADEARRRATEALRWVRAEDWAARRPQELSGGQQQRIALARALAHEPALLLLDEPLSNLDVASRLELRSVLRRLVREKGTTILCVLHDQKDALAMADRLGVMRGGKIIQSGVPIDVYRRPVDSWTATFLGMANLFKGKVLQVGAGEFVAETPLGEVRGALATPAPPPKVGSEITVCIRPECLHLDAMPPEENAFGGKVADSLFQGDHSLHDFATPCGVVLKVAEFNPRQRVGSKAKLYAWAEPEDVVGLQS